MKYCSRTSPSLFIIIVVMALFCLACSCFSAEASTPDYQTRPGTINHTLTLCDGAEVVLDSVVIRYVSSPYIYVSDPWDASNTLPVYANVDLKPWLAAEITGRTATIGGKRIIIASRVRLYTDCRGCPFYLLPKFRVPLLWDWMLEVPLGDMPQNIPPPSDMESLQSMQASMSGVLWTPDSGVLPEDPITLGSVDGVIVTADETDFTDYIFYVEDPNRAFGWKVVYTGATDIDRGDKVTVTGDALIDDNEEAYIDATSVTIIGTGEVAPVGMIGKVLGGADMDYKPGVNCPVGHGLYNKGLLARSCGKVTYIDQANKYFYMDDGSGLDDGNTNGALGVKVSWDEQAVSSANPAIIAPQEDWFVSVTGISSSENPQDDDVIRVLRPRRQEDIQVQNITDSSNPYVTITNPPGDELHMASGQTTAQLSGIATDPDTGIISVLIGFTATGIETPPTAWNNAGYNSVTHVWAYDWQSPQAQRVWVKATDFAMHTTIIYRDVTVSSVTVIYVKPNGSDGNNGSSWALAKATVQAGLNAAYNMNPKAEVWVAAGTYVQRITLANGVGLYGGFAGTEGYREGRDWSINVTILDGNQGGTVVTSPSGATVSTVIDGFTLKNGLAGGYYGGGIYCSSSSPTISNNIITGNRVASGYGGGIYCSSSSSPKISNNIIAGNSASYGGGICCSYSSPVITNNTITGNSASIDGGGIYCVYSSPTISNNIVAFNSSGILNYSGMPVPRNNCVYGNTAFDYYGLSPDAGGISVDPKLVDRANGNYHILPDSPCIDAGYDNAVQTGWIDMDGQARIQISHVDIGADEASAEMITLTPVVATASCSSSVTLTAQVFDCETHQTVAGRRVDMMVSTGSITSISPNGHLNTPPVLGWGVTDLNGNVTITISTPADPQTMTVTATISTEVGLVSAQSTIYVGQRRVGFLCSICEEEARNNIDSYLARINNYCDDVVYDRIPDFQSGIDSSYSVVFVAMPVRNLTTSELNTLSAFVQSGREKRVVLIGEYNPNYRAYNDKLNLVAAEIGMITRFSEGTNSYDIGINLDHLCTVNLSHYLTTDVINLWDAATDTFVAGWESYARPLAYIYQEGYSTLPWILEEDTTTAGSRIIIHDASLFVSSYNDVNDTVPDKNFKFVHNLCTIFPQ